MAARPWRAETALAMVAARMGDHEQADKHRAEANALRIEEYVERVLASSPPLSDEAKERIAALLTSGGGAR